MGLYSKDKIDEVTTAFPVGSAVKAFRDGVYNWAVGRVRKYDIDSSGSECGLVVAFRDGMVINYPFEMVSARDIASSYVRESSKSATVDETYPIGAKVLVHRDNTGDAWDVGSVSKKGYDKETHEVTHVIIRHVHGLSSFPIIDFEDDGTHERIRVLRPKRT